MSVWRLIYVFWAQGSIIRCAESTWCTQTRVYSARGKYIVRHRTSREASLRHSSGWGTWSVSPQYRDLRTRDLNRPSEKIPRAPTWRWGECTLLKTLMELIFNLSGEFRWSPNGPVSQIHSSHLHVGAPGNADLSRSVQMLKRESRVRKTTGRYCTYLFLVFLLTYCITYTVYAISNVYYFTNGC